MCGGVIVHWQSVPDPEHIGQMMRIGTEERVLSFSYSRKPMIPAEKDGVTNLYVWGNRDRKDSKLPHTGWCRAESVDEGKWNWLRPIPILIPAIGGIEKGKWMRFDGGMKGLLVEDEKKFEHVYMLTQPATEDYARYTKHPRMPMLLGGWEPMEAPQNI